MMKLSIPLFAALVVAVIFPAPARAQSQFQRSPWEQSVVSVEVTRKQYDAFQPWTRRVRTAQKMGLVIGPDEILTTADELFDQTLIRLQKGGRGRWYRGELKWIDYHANLALVGSSEENFWNDLKPAQLEDFNPSRDDLQIARWRGGNFDIRKAEFSRFVAQAGHLTYVSCVQLEASSDIQGAGWAEPMISNGKVVGLTSSHGGSTVTALPAGFIKPILEARKKGEYKGLGFFDFFWQPAENPSIHEFLGREGEPAGVIVIEVPERPGVEAALKPRDLILKVDEFDIDIQGDYKDPDFGHLNLENLATRRKWAGDTVKLKIWRDGQLKDVTYKLPKADYTESLVPDAVYDQAPEYLIVGGLVFQPLTDEYLKGYGADWRARAPFRLNFYNNEDVTPERPALVLLTQVLPDVYNIGYQELRNLVLDEVNGVKISRLADLKEALEKPIDGFHQVKFMQSDSLRHMILSAADLEQSTKRVLQRYGIQDAAVIAETSKPATTAGPKS